MRVFDLIGADAVIPGLRATDKAQVMKALSAKAASDLAIEAPVVLAALNAREEIGATSVGRGVAIPHARVAGLQRMFGLFATLDQPVDFDAFDAEPVDLVFLLLSPRNGSKEYLAALACVSRTLSNHFVAERLRFERSPRRLYNILVGDESEPVQA